MSFVRLFRCCVYLFIATLCINGGMVLSTQKFIYRDMETLPAKTAVLVLGSQIRQGRPSPVLRDRINAGILILESGKGGKLLLSGDHGRTNYDEVNVMRHHVLDNSPVHKEDIFMDHAGFSTYDSMYRARDVFEVKDLVIVTQEFHINRAVYIARALGLDAVGFAVNQDRFGARSLRFWKSREYLARIKAFFSVLFKTKPRYLGKKIPITGDGRATWD
ncbi:MAG: YdcF family protein [Treponema sp.]|jgi:SanA protein|nr:YdcF family protein [Treponema sp.]